jgi:acyl-CoA synthetase (AMP-forming)/AMP-acid ligase II
MTPSPAGNFSEVLAKRAALQPERDAFAVWSDNGAQDWMTYRQLDERARAIAVALRAVAQPGDRVLLLYPPGLAYVTAFFGCLHAGVIAVPAYPPDPSRLDRTLPRLLAMIADAGATVVLTTSELLAMAQPIAAFAPELAALRWIASDGLRDHAAWQVPGSSPRSVAFLQYTSGSTGDPKGVRLTHANLLHNSDAIRRAEGNTPDSRMVIWLPPYHDMGLIGCILQSVYTGFPCVLMSPMSFLMRPLRWLQAITAMRATISGGPNFAFDLCARKIGPEHKRQLDLSSWECAVIAAEPVQAATMRRFSAAFAECGFRASAFYPCYGLAEGTLIVSGVAFGSGFRADDAGVRLGNEVTGGRLAIVDPARGRRVADGTVGEVWLQSDSVADGYWNRPEESRATFGAKLAGEGGSWLRTGDLGRVVDGELIITGRLKELIIIRGRKHYPGDLEATVENVHWEASHFRAGGSVAVSQVVDGEERLFLIVELERRQRARRSGPALAVDRRGGRDRRRRPFEYRAGAVPFTVDEVVLSLRNTIAMHHGVEVAGVVLVRPGSIPKTSSGKKQRLLAREMFLAGEALPRLGTALVAPRADVLQRWFADRPGRPRDELTIKARLA